VTLSKRKIDLHRSWLTHLQGEFGQPYMVALRQFLAEQKAEKKLVFPPGKPFDQIKVVILGQDPYHGPGQAHGLCFSVLPGVPFPPSLLNIFKEIQQDIGAPIPSHGCLQGWADQGVLLLNATLTVEQAKAGSHQGQGWELFTDKVIQTVNEHSEGVVFLLWGAYAQKKGGFIDAQKHLVLKSPHPSPLSAHRGFFGNGHFSKANAWLVEQGRQPIQWAEQSA